MNQTTTIILREIAQTGQSVILNNRTRDLHAALDLIKCGICYRSHTLPDYFVIKFGRQPMVIETKEAIYHV